MERTKRLPKLAAFTAPLMILGAAALESGCSQNQPKTPAEASRTPEGEVKPAPSYPTSVSSLESFEPTLSTAKNRNETHQKVENPTNLEPVTSRDGQEIHTAFRGNFAYTYELTPVTDILYSLQSIKVLINDPGLNSYVKKDTARTELTQIYEEIIAIAGSNPKDPQIAGELLKASQILEDNCDNNFKRLAMRANLWIIKSIDQDLWGEKQFEFIDSGCLINKRFVISPEFKIKPLPDGTFIYEGVTYQDVINFAGNLSTVYDPTVGNYQRILDWLEYAKANQGNLSEEANGWNSATHLIVGSCERSDKSVNTLRLAESVVARTYPQTPFAQTSHSRHRSCFAYFMGDDQYFSNR